MVEARLDSSSSSDAGELMGLPLPKRVSIAAHSAVAIRYRGCQAKRLKQGALTQKQVSRLIPQEQKLLLEAITEFGLSDNGAGALIGLTSCSRILHGLREQRQ